MARKLASVFLFFLFVAILAAIYIRSEKGRADSPALDGCDPSVFADQINAYLDEAAADRAALQLEIGDEAEREWGDPSNFELFPDVIPLLEVLRASSCTVGLVSNTDRDLETFAAQLGIGVDFALASGAHGRRKPCETIFAAALALGGAPASQGVMVGDSVDDDIAGAARCGLRAVLVDRHARYPDHPGERVGGLAELPPLLGLAATAPASPRATT